MNRRIKIFLILFFAILFFLGCPTAIFYSQGYRFDFETRKLVKVGAFFFKTQPESCQIYLDGELKKKTDFLFGNAFVKNILPKEYNIRIEKEGYFPWEKTLEVKEELVTEAKSITLFPKNPNFSILLSNINDYFFSPDDEKLILKKSNKQGWSLEILDLERNSQEVLIEEQDLIKGGLLDLNWGSDSRNILLKTETQYFIVNTEEKQTFPLNYGNIQKVSFNPDNPQEIFFLKTLNGNKNLLRVNFSTKELPEVILKNPISYKFSNENIYWLSPDGFLYRSSISGENSEALNTEPFSIIKNSKYEIEIFSPAVFLKEDNNLYLLDFSTKIFKKFSDSIKNIELSPNSRKAVITNNYEIWILFLTDTDDQPRRKLGQEMFLTRFSQKIGRIFWLNNNYLIFNIENKLKIAEIDDRDRINIIELAEFENPKIFWNQELENIYILANEELYLSTNLLP